MMVDLLWDMYGFLLERFCVCELLCFLGVWFLRGICECVGSFVESFGGLLIVY